MPPLRTLALLTLIAALPSCGGTDAFADARDECVAEINRYRATEGLAPLERWTEQEGCSDGQARRDSSDGPHANFGDCEERAQNTCPGWPGVEAVVGGCLQAMWNEGPPPSEPCNGACFQAHGHYINMSNPGYTRVACGFHEMSDGRIWSSQNFR